MNILRSYEALIDDVQPGERSVVARINTGAVDRFRTVIDPAGVRTDAYRRNPVVLWEHGLDPTRGSVPVGRNVWVKPRQAEKDLIAKTVFHDDAFSRNIFELYKSGTLRGFSIRAFADPARSSPPTSAEIRSRPELADCKMVYRACDLGEYSSVAVPGNREALALAVSRGLWVPDDVRAALAGRPSFPQRSALRPLVGCRLATVIEARRAAIREYFHQDPNEMVRFIL